MIRSPIRAIRSGSVIAFSNFDSPSAVSAPNFSLACRQTSVAPGGQLSAARPGGGHGVVEFVGQIGVEEVADQLLHRQGYGEQQLVGLVVSSGHCGRRTGGCCRGLEGSRILRWTRASLAEDSHRSWGAPMVIWDLMREGGDWAGRRGSSNARAEAIFWSARVEGEGPSGPTLT